MDSSLLNQAISESLWSIFLPAILMICGCLLSILFIKIIIIKYKFNRSIYQEESGNKFLKTIFNTGHYGEFLTCLEFEKMDGIKHILLNVYLNKEDDKTTEIDLIVLTQRCIFIVESKNYSGAIYGKENDYNWTQVTGNKKYKFYNPIKQNETHIKAISKELPNISKNKFISLIVFSERCELKKIAINSNIPVIKRNKLHKTLKKYKKLPVSYSQEEIKNIYKHIKKRTNQSEEVKRQHILNITK